MLIINMELPNNPVSKGSRGSFTPIFKTHNPSKPEMTNTKRAVNFFLSVKIRRKEVASKIQSITECIVLYTLEIKKDNGKERITKIKTAQIPPFAVSITAS